MRGIPACGLALLALALPSAAPGQTYEELQKEVQQLRVRNAELEAQLALKGVQTQAESTGTAGIIVHYDPATTRLVVKVGEKERTIVLKPEIHVHDEKDQEVPPDNRTDRLKPGVRITMVEEDGQIIEINLGAAHAPHHQHDHAHAAEWKHVDPFYKGWRKPSDDYRPYSWKAPENESFCKDLFCGQYVDTHRSPSGTPWVHPFTIEPPQLHRDAFFIYAYAKDAEGGPTDEHELEVHLDWGLTRRLGILIGVPYLGLLGPDGQATGFGDLEIGPRLVFIETDAFYLSANILITVPTGDEERDLGAGETVIAPFLTTWNDLGGYSRLPWRNWNTMFLNAGPEYGLQSGDGALNYTVVLAHSFLGPKLLFPHQHGNGHSDSNGGSHRHDGAGHAPAATGGIISVLGPAHPAGLTSIILEFNGQTELQGEERTLLQLLTGFSYSLTENAELRFGVNFPLNQPRLQFDTQYIFAFEHTF